MSVLSYCGSKFTIRIVEKEGLKVEKDALEAIRDSIDFALNHLGIDGHLFVTVVGTEAFRMSDNPEDKALGIYHSSIQHIAICGAIENLEPFDGSRENWLEELKITAVHEVIHYWQELQGNLTESEESEVKCIQITAQICDAMEEGRG